MKTESESYLLEIMLWLKDAFKKAEVKMTGTRYTNSTSAIQTEFKYRGKKYRVTVEEL